MGQSAAAVVRKPGSPASTRGWTCLGDEALLHHEVAHVVWAIAAEAEAGEAAPRRGVDQLVFRKEAAEVLQDLGEGRRVVDLLL